MRLLRSQDKYYKIVYHIVRTDDIDKESVILEPCFLRTAQRKTNKDPAHRADRSDVPKQIWINY